MLLSVIPLQTLSLMGNAQDASTLLFAVSIGGILAALTLPAVIRRIGVYPAFLISCLAMVISAILMAIEQVWIFSIGLFCHAFAIASAEVTLTLYVLAKIRRNDMTSFEPLRVLFTVLALTAGPFLGVYFEARIFLFSCAVRREAASCLLTFSPLPTPSHGCCTDRLENDLISKFDILRPISVTLLTLFWMSDTTGIVSNTPFVKLP